MTEVNEKLRISKLYKRIEELNQEHTSRVKTIVRRTSPKAAKHITRLIVPDSHGNHIHGPVVSACVADARRLQPDEIVMVGDHVDCGGLFSAHQRSYTKEIGESYEDDVEAGNRFLDALQEAAPNAEIHYIEGNHEAHVERWIARNIDVRKDAEALLRAWGPPARLALDKRGVKYYRTSEFYHGLTIPGTIKLGKCHFTHGISHALNCAQVHLSRFNSNIVFGHVHRSISLVSRTVSSQGHGAWCVGTLAELQPLYMHTNPTTWTWGHGVQLVNKSTGRFAHFNVPLYGDGTSGLDELVGRFGGK
jgi:metallophosphoesterase superfamily enzyme